MVSACLSRVSTIGKYALSGLIAVSIASTHMGKERIASVANGALTLVGGLECMKCAFQGCLKGRKCAPLCMGLLGVGLSLTGIASMVFYSLPEIDGVGFEGCEGGEASIAACQSEVHNALVEFSSCPDIVKYLTPPVGQSPPNITCDSSIDPKTGVTWSYTGEKWILVSSCIKEHLQAKLLNGLVAIKNMGGKDIFENACKSFFSAKAFSEAMERKEWVNINMTFALAKKCNNWLIHKLPYWQHFEFPTPKEDWRTPDKYLANSGEHRKLYEELWVKNCRDTEMTIPHEDL